MATLGTEESSHCSPLSPKSDQHQFSPNNTNALSKEKGVRINKMITKWKMINDLLSNSLNLFFKEMYGD